jgi:C-terminal processing protease CtpA/Prc
MRSRTRGGHAVVWRLLFPMLILAASATDAASQLSGQDRERARRILHQVHENLKKFYYDSTFGGRDMKAAARRADSLIGVAPSMPHALGAIAQFLGDLQDSHTTFWPPQLRDEFDYGFRKMIIGDSVYITGVKKGSDAEAKGLRRGDLLLAMDQMRTTRATMRVIDYVYDYLSPRRMVTLTIRKVGEAQPQRLVVNAKVTPGEPVIDFTSIEVRNRYITQWMDEDRAPTQFYRTLGDSVFIWRMPSFVYGDEVAIDEMVDRARKYPSLIFDLRSNSGGSVQTELYLIGKFFDKEIPVLTMVTRDSTSLRVAKPTDKEPYKGKLVVLINSRSASAAEIFARVMQLQGRAVVVGDRSWGAVITSIGLSGEVGGVERKLTYGMSVSISDVIMPDGKRLENAGVIPDYLVLPTGEDLASGADPQLAKALELVGTTVTPLAASKLGRLASGKPD